LALDSGGLDLAIGFLPTVHDTERVELLTDRYIVLLREAHPFVPGKRGRAVKLDALAELEYVAVRSHSETIRILQLLRLEHRVRLTTTYFLALPAIVRTTELGVVMPRAIAAGFVAAGGHKIIEPQLPMREFTVALHWSRRYEKDPAHRWARALIVRLFKGRGWADSLCETR
jgi:DNA-binding transcriptional LysR family regulator